MTYNTTLVDEQAFQKAISLAEFSWCQIPDAELSESIDKAIYEAVQNVFQKLGDSPNTELGAIREKLFKDVVSQSFKTQIDAAKLVEKIYSTYLSYVNRETNDEPDVLSLKDFPKGSVSDYAIQELNYRFQEDKEFALQNRLQLNLYDHLPEECQKGVMDSCLGSWNAETAIKILPRLLAYQEDDIVSLVELLASAVDRKMGPLSKVLFSKVESILSEDKIEIFGDKICELPNIGKIEEDYYKQTYFIPEKPKKTLATLQEEIEIMKVAESVLKAYECEDYEAVKTLLIELDDFAKSGSVNTVVERILAEAQNNSNTDLVRFIYVHLSDHLEIWANSIAIGYCIQLGEEEMAIEKLIRGGEILTNDPKNIFELSALLTFASDRKMYTLSTIILSKIKLLVDCGSLEKLLDSYCEGDGGCGAWIKESGQKLNHNSFSPFKVYSRPAVWC